MSAHETQDDLLHQYWQALARDPDAGPPAGLDPAMAHLVRRIEQDLKPPRPDTAFVRRLHDRLAREADALASSRPREITNGRRPGGAVPLRLSSRPLLAGLAIAAVLVVAAVGVELRSNRVETVSAAEIVRRAGAAPTSPTRFRTFVVTETSETRPAALAGSDDRIRSEVTRWYEAPGRWRREVTSVVLGPDDQVLSRSGLTSVSDGSTVWIHRTRDNVVIVRPYTPEPSGEELGPFPEVTGGLSALLSQAGACYTPRLAGSDTVAGRATYVIDLGRSRCTPGAAAGTAGLAGTELVEWSIWVDKETFLILKSVQDIDGEVFATTTVTGVQYDVPIEPSRFTFDPPPGARVRDARAPSGPAVRPTARPGP